MTPSEDQPTPPSRPSGETHPDSSGLEQLLPGRKPLPHAEEKGDFFVYQRELAPGTRLEHYELVRVLGSGGFGITYLAKDLFLNRHVVLKENFPTSCAYRDPLTGHIRPNNEHDLDNYTWALKSFLAEAQTLAELNHPGIVRILSVFEANGTAYFAMEHITGLSLDYLGEKLNSTGHRYTEDELKGLLTRLLKILDYLHSNHIYHRDIKPGNILLTEEGTPVLIDFGAARHALKMTGNTVLTTQGYSSPEQALGKTNSGPWSDLYSVGATFHALLMGHPPERGEARLQEDSMPPLHSNPHLMRIYSRQFLLSLDKSLSPQINCRYQSAQEWIRDIGSISGEESSATIHVTPAEIHQAHPEYKDLSRLTPGSRKQHVSHHRRASARTIRHHRHMIYLLVGVLGTVLIGVGGFYLLDYLKKAPMGTTITTIKDVIQQPSAGLSGPLLPAVPKELSAIPIPELKITEDAALETKTLHRFQLRLNDSTLSRSNLPTPLPQELRVSCIYLQIIPTPNPKEELYLTIRNGDGTLICRSDNPIPSFTVPGQSTITFTFPSLPVLETALNYTYAFETGDHQVRPVAMSCFHSNPSGTETIFPKIRLIVNPPLRGETDLNAPGIQRLINLFTSTEPYGKKTLKQLQVTPANFAWIKTLAQAGYPNAQYTLAKALMEPDCPGGAQPEQSVEWLYKAAVGGCDTAMKDMGKMLMNIPSYFPSLPQQPALVGRDYANAARFLRMAVQYKDQEALYLLSLMYSQGWGVPASAELSQLMMKRLKGSRFLTANLNTNAVMIAYWLNLSLPPEQTTILACTIPAPFAHEELQRISLHNTCSEYSFGIRKINVLQKGKLLLDIIAPQEILPGKASSPIGIAIPKGLLSDTTQPLELEIQMTPGASCGVVELLPSENRNQTQHPSS